MMRFKSVELTQHYHHGYSLGAVPGARCEVTLQIGEHSYNTTKLRLSPEATKRVIQAALKEAQDMMTLDIDDVDVEGKPGAPEPEPVMRGGDTKAIHADEVEPL